MADVVDRTEAAPAASGPSRMGLAAWAAVAVSFAAPVVWVIVTHTTRYTGDMAIIEMRVRDVLSAHPPVAGAYSRYGWAHPGPAQFYVFALPYRVLGGDARALQMTTLGFNLAVAATTVWLAHRRDRATAIIVGLGVVALVAGAPPMTPAYGWNVTVTLLPFVLVAVACWRAVDGDDRAVPFAAAAAVFVVQAHVGVGVVVLPLVLATATAVARRWRRRGPASTGERPMAARGATVAVLVAAVLPLAWDVAANPPGNVGRLANWSVANDEPQVGMSEAMRMIGRSSSISFLRDPELPGRFLLELEPTDAGLAPGASIALLLACLGWAHRRGWRSERDWCATIAALWVTAVVAAASITRPLGWWLVQWLQPLGWLTWTAVVLVAWRLTRERIPPRRARTVSGAGLGVAGTLAVAAAIGHAIATIGAPHPEAELARPVDALTAAVEAARDERSIRLESAGPSLLAESMLSGVVNRLDALGGDVCVDADMAYKLGEHRVCGPGPHRRLVVRFEPRTAPPPPGTEPIADVDPLTPAQRSEADALADRIDAVLTEAGRSDLVPVLDSPLAHIVLRDDPPPQLVAIAGDVERLAALRRIDGERYVLYAEP